MSANSFIDLAAITCDYKNKWFCIPILLHNAVKKYWDKSSGLRVELAKCYSLIIKVTRTGIFSYKHPIIKLVVKQLYCSPLLDVYDFCEINVASNDFLNVLFRDLSENEITMIDATLFAGLSALTEL